LKIRRRAALGRRRCGLLETSAHSGRGKAAEKPIFSFSSSEGTRETFQRDRHLWRGGPTRPRCTDEACEFQAVRSMFYTIHMRFPSLCFSLALAIWIWELVGSVLLEVDVKRDSSAGAVFQVRKSYRISSELGSRRLDLDRERARPRLLGDDNF